MYYQDDLWYLRRSWSTYLTFACLLTYLTYLPTYTYSLTYCLTRAAALTPYILLLTSYFLPTYLEQLPDALHSADPDAFKAYTWLQVLMKEEVLANVLHAERQVRPLHLPTYSFTYLPSYLLTYLPTYLLLTTYYLLTSLL